MARQVQNSKKQTLQFFWRGKQVACIHRKGPGDDLATAGLGFEGIASPTSPHFRNPEAPTADELRRRAIYENYRAIADTSPNGGYGVFYGPGVGDCPELIPGYEYTTYGVNKQTLLLQVPDSFDPSNPGLILAPASSSRSVYGGIFVAEWALKRGYAVVYSDKGAGTGFHDLTSDRVVMRDGRVRPRSEAQNEENFVAPDGAEALEAFKRSYPNRLAAKHAHSGLHCEALWGEYILESVLFAFSILSSLYPGQVDPQTTMVIASGVSNGAAASLKAAELDSVGMIDGVAVAEPNITPDYEPRLSIVCGQREPFTAHSASLLEYAGLLNLLQPIASLAEAQESAPFNKSASPDRLRGLQQKGIWRGLSVEEAAERAQRLLREAGLLPEQEALAPSHSSWGIYEAITVNTANCYGRFLVSDHLAGLSYAAVDSEKKRPKPVTEAEMAALFALSNGIVPTAGLSIVNDLSPDGPVESRYSRSASTGYHDQNLDGALQLVGLALGRCPLTDEPLREELVKPSKRIRGGKEELTVSADLRGKPAIIVNGRCDGFIAPNHASRPYFGKNLLTETDSRLRYVEVVHAQHLDSLNALPDFATRYVPLCPYLFQALDMVEANIKNGQELPQSQVVRSCPRSSAEEPLSRRHIPAFKVTAQEQNRIEMRGHTLHIPD